MQTTETKLKKVKGGHRGRTIVFSIVIFFLVAIVSGLWYWNTHKKRIIKNKLETVIQEKSGGLYKIKYDSLSIDEMDGYLSISNMNLSYDSARYTELTKQGHEPSILLNIHIPEISVSGVKTPKALIGDEIIGRKLEIKNPVINIMYTNPGKDSSQAVPPKAIYEQILGDLDLIKADSILISGAQITTSNFKTKKTGMQLQDVNITLVDVKVDSSSSTDSTRMFFSKETSFTCGKLSWSSPDNLYSYNVENISAGSVSRLLRIKSFSMVPALDEEAFVKALPAQGDRFDFSVSNIEMKNIDMQQLLEENIVADNILLPSPSLKIYRDLAIPRDTKNRVGAYPHQLMQTIPITFTLGKIVVTNGFIEYKERHHTSRQAGKIQYHTINAVISNFTNDKKAIAANNVMTVDMSAQFLNKAPLKVSGQFYLLDANGRFNLSGTLGAMDATVLNPVIENTGLTHIRSGKIKKAEFNVQGSDHVADGKITLLYDDLKVNVLEKDKGSAELDKKGLASFMANMAIKNANPLRKDPVRVAQVHLERNNNASFFNFAWKTLLKGIMETVGLK
ncbi:MAG: DUF748 domain-containing protein [Chitinophagaceae bacterium]|nr:DUF748 domain-containing protein [Chitinophagaceae bacterium]